jgi:hypothetical protein
MSNRIQRLIILGDTIYSLMPGIRAVKNNVAITEKFTPYTMIKVHFDLLMLFCMALFYSKLSQVHRAYTEALPKKVIKENDLLTCQR